MNKFGKGGFGKGNKTSGFGRSSGSGFGSKSRGFGSNNSEDRGGEQKSYGSNRGDGPKFISVGDVTVSKSSIEAMGEEVIDQLKDSKMKLWFKPYFRKGTNSLILTRNSKLLISFDNFEKAPDFVVAKVSIVAEE